MYVLWGIYLIEFFILFIFYYIPPFSSSPLSIFHRFAVNLTGVPLSGSSFFDISVFIILSLSFVILITLCLGLFLFGSLRNFYLWFFYCNCLLLTIIICIFYLFVCAYQSPQGSQTDLASCPIFRKKSFHIPWKSDIFKWAKRKCSFIWRRGYKHPLSHSSTLLRVESPTLVNTVQCVDCCLI